MSYFDRQTLPVAISAIQRSIPLSNQQFSWLQFAFLITYALLYAGGGRMLDLLGTRRGFLLIMLWWSLACASQGLASSVPMLAVPGWWLSASEPNAVLVVSAENRIARAVAEPRYLVLPLRHDVGAFLQNKFLLLAERRLRIHRRQKVTIALHQAGSHGTKFNIMIEPVKDGLIGKHRVVYDLSIVGRLFRHPSLQLHQDSGISRQHALDLG